MTTLAAFDLSLTATGWATATDDGPVAFGVLSPPRQMGGVVRLAWLRDQILDRVGSPPFDVDLVVLEGYAFARPNQAHQLGELGGVVRLALFEAGIRWLAVPPAVLKKFATGRGNAKKAEVLTEAVRRLHYGGSNDNEADALWLLHMARVYYGLVPPAVPKVQQEALVKIAWPLLAQPVGQAADGAPA